MARWLNAITTRFLAPSRKRSTHAARPALRVEVLEDRLAPAALAWVGGGGTDHSWTNPANWAGGALPDSTSDVIISSDFAGITITSSANVSLNSISSEAALTIKGGTFTIAAGDSAIDNTLTIASAGTLTSNANLHAAQIINAGKWHQSAPADVSALSFSSGAIDGPGTVTVTGSFTWTGGTLGSASSATEGTLRLAATATGSFTGTAGKVAIATLENAGQITYSGSWLELGYADANGYNFHYSHLYNRPGATFTIVDSSTVCSTYVYGGSGEFDNEGTLIHTGTGTSYFAYSTQFVTLDNSGTVSVQQGALSVLSVAQLPLSGTSCHTLSGGTWSVSVGATLSLARPAINTITTNNANIILDGAGSAFTNLAALATNNGSLRLLDGRVFTTVAALTNNGQLIIDATSSLSVTGNYTQTTAAALETQTGSTASTTPQNRLAVRGTPTFSGTMNVVYTSNVAVGPTTDLNTSEGDLLLLVLASTQYWSASSTTSTTTTTVSNPVVNVPDSGLFDVATQLADPYSLQGQLIQQYQNLPAEYHDPSWLSTAINNYWLSLPPNMFSTYRAGDIGAFE